MRFMLDALIIGGGPAGLSAALVLGRARRRVVLLDDGQGRNHVTGAVHGFLTRDGVAPDELRRLACEQLKPYGVECVRLRAVAARRAKVGFDVELEDGATLTARKLLLATGVRDVLPDVPGFAPLYGTSAHHCPFCDGWEARDLPLLALAKGPEAVDYALLLTTWSKDVVLCTDGEALAKKDRKRLEAAAVVVKEERLARLEGHGAQLERAVFADGEALPRRSLFFHLGTRPTSDLAKQLGLAQDEDAGVHASAEEEKTSKDGVYVAGDASKDVLLVIVAAAEGAKAAVDIHLCLLEEDLASRG
jgi:thioredoxin reductase